MSKILSIDFGTKKCGIAISDDELTFAIRLNQINYKKPENLIDEIGKLIKSNDIKKIILGLPTDTYQNETSITQRVKAFKSTLKKNFNLEVILWDEYLTSQNSRQNSKTQIYKKKHIDSESARIILQEYLEYLLNKN